MTPQEIELWKYAIDEITRAWFIGTLAISLGIGSIRIKNIFNKGREE